MNNLQPFEKHLADQLQQITLLNKEEGWIEMRKLLDRELPEGGTAWSGNRKWWWMGITVAIIITGLWMSEELHHKQQVSGNEQAVSKQQSGQTDITSSKKLQEKNSNNLSSPVQNSSPSNVKASNEVRKADADNVANTNLVTENKTKTGEGKSNRGEYSNPNKTKTGIGIGAATASVDKRVSGNAQSVVNSKHVSENSVVVDNRDLDVNNGMEEETLMAAPISSVSTAESVFIDPKDALSSIPSSYEPLKAEPGKTDKAFAKEMRKQSVKADDRKMSAREMRGEVKEKDRDLTFAAGLALPQSFAIAGQQAAAYGVNANSSRASDYLPVPFFQYHMNSRLFFQTELQFQSPQYTDRLLVYQDQQQVAQTNTMLEKNIFIEKLYYFHIPFNVYFSPARNFYVGSGIQFSSLLSGVATYQNNRYTSGTLENSYSKVEGFKDDSLASKLSSSEWRYQLDANYYLKRFTFGARYNQAFSQFVNIQPSPTLPSTVGKNQSFFVYLRYNIWEERKK